MPLYLQKELPQGGALALWRIEEAENWFSSQLSLSAENETELAKIAHPRRRLQWMACRLMLQKLFPETVNVYKSSSGKPSSKHAHIAIAHARELAAVLVHPTLPCGVDVELIEIKIQLIAHKFLSEKEREFINPNTYLQQLYIIWSAKETMYKWYGLGEMDFRKNLSIHSFEYKDSGELSGEIEKENFKSHLKITYEIHGDYVVTWMAQKL